MITFLEGGAFLAASFFSCFFFKPLNCNKTPSVDYPDELGTVLDKNMQNNKTQPRMNTKYLALLIYRTTDVFWTVVEEAGKLRITRSRWGMRGSEGKDTQPRTSSVWAMVTGTVEAGQPFRSAAP